jgi:ArsR family transcriptional regulator
MPMDYRVCCPKDEDTKRDWEESLTQEKKALPPEEALEGLRKVFESLSHPIRLRIASHLMVKEYCVCELIFMLGLEANLVSYHLREMRKARIVSASMRSGWKYYSLNENARHFLSKDMLVGE